MSVVQSMPKPASQDPLSRIYRYYLQTSSAGIAPRSFGS